MKMATRRLTAGSIVAAVFDRAILAFPTMIQEGKRTERITMLTGATQQ